MEEQRKQELYKSLVGSSIVFNFERSDDRNNSVVQNIEASKVKIGKYFGQLDTLQKTNSDVKLIHQTVFLAEMLSYYVSQPFYMAVRSVIKLGRIRPFVLDYLNDTPMDKRVETLISMVEDSKGLWKEMCLEAIRYFLAVHPSRCRDFRGVLSKEDFMYVV